MWRSRWGFSGAWNCSSNPVSSPFPFSFSLWEIKRSAEKPDIGWCRYTCFSEKQIETLRERWHVYVQLDGRLSMG